MASDTQSVQDGLREARLRINIGDLEGALPRVRAALESGDLDAEDALVWSQTFAGDQIDLARDLWRHAVSLDIDDQTALKAYGVSFNLGLENEKADLFAAVARLAETGQGVWSVSLDQLKTEIAERQERAAELDDQWKRGVAPVHLLAKAAGASLAEIFDLQPDPHGRRPVFLRSGSRGDAWIDERPIAKRRYFLDVSALLIADQLELLPVLEGLGPRLCIGAATSHALLEIEHATRHHQPAQGKAPRRVVAEIGRRIGVAAPVGTQRVALESQDGTTMDLNQVLAGLEAAESATPDALSAWRLALGIDVPATTWPLAGVRLEFSERSLESLIDIGAFETVVETYAVFVDPISLRAAQRAVEDLQRRARLTLAVGRLRRHLARKAATHYDFVGGGRPDLNPNDDPFSITAVGRALAEVMTAAGEDEANRLWLEDRYLSSFGASGRAPVVGILDVLADLRAQRRIDDETYFDRLLRLRAGSALFLPLSVEEIEHHLTAAPIREGAVTETPALAILRRNMGLALVYGEKLRLVTTGEADERPLELPFLLHLRRICETAVLSRWNGQTPVETARAQSDWIWRSLRAETLPRPNETDAIAGAETVTALNFAGLLTGAFHLRSAAGDPGWRRREQYFAWLGEAVIKDRLAFDPVVRDRTVDLARDLFRLDRAETDDLDGEAIESVRALSRVIVSQLPEPIRDLVTSDPDFMADLGFTETTAILLDEKTFAASIFWRGVADAINEGRGEAGFNDSSGRVIFTRAADDPLRLDLSGDVETPALLDPDFGLLSETEAVRQASLEALWAECDIPPSDREAVAADILGQTLPERRIKRARDVRYRSIRLFLEGLATTLQSGEDVGADVFTPPAAVNWLTYVRWRDPETRIEAAAAALRRDLSPEAALARMASLPFTLPKEAWAGVDLARVRMLTPLACIHRLHAARQGHLPGESESLVDHVRATAEAAARFGGLFAALLRWGTDAFARQPGWNALTPLQKHVVTWCFADRLTDLLGTIGLEPEPGAAFFRTQRVTASGAALLVLERGYDDSSLHPSAASLPLLLLAGLEHGLGETAHALALPSDVLEAVAGALEIKPDAVDRRPVVRRYMPRDEVGPTWMDRPSPGVLADGHDLEQMLSEAITALEACAEDPNAWAFLYGVGTPAVSSDQTGKLAVVLHAVDLAAIAAGIRPDQTLRHVAEVAGRLAGQAAGAAVIEKLLDLAPSWLESSEGALEARFDTLFEAGAAASRSYDDQGAERFSQFLMHLMIRLPQVAARLRSVLDAVIDLTPVRDAGPFWNALKAVRAL